MESNNENLKIPQEKNVFILVLLSIITIGIYPFFWYIKHSEELNNLRTKNKLRKSISLIPLTIYIGVILLVAMNIILGSTVWADVKDINSLNEIPLVFQISIILFVFLILLLTLSAIFVNFRIKKILNQALENKESTKNDKIIKLSSILTLVFGLFYLQYEINRIIDDNEDKLRKTPWMIFFIMVVLLGIIIWYYLYIY